jgi:dihydrofolate reductase
MGKIVISANVTLDGVVEDPTGEEGFKHGGWWVQVGSSDREGFYRAALDETLRAEALLFGRRSYEYFAERWPSRTGELPDRMNGMSKYVVSSTLEDPGWSNTTVVKGDVVTAVSKLKERLTGEIVVIGSLKLVRTLLAGDLADEVRLLVYPYALGDGERLFGEIPDKLSLRLVGNRTVGDGLPYLTYQVVRAG